MIVKLSDLQRMNVCSNGITSWRKLNGVTISELRNGVETSNYSDAQSRLIEKLMRPKNGQR